MPVGRISPRTYVPNSSMISVKSQKPKSRLAKILEKTRALLRFRDFGGPGTPPHAFPKISLLLLWSTAPSLRLSGIQGTCWDVPENQSKENRSSISQNGFDCFEDHIKTNAL